MNNKAPRYVIIDPASAEVVRSNYAYYSHFLYSALRVQGKEVYIHENWTPVDTIIPADYYYVALWSYPQIEFVQHLRGVLDSSKTLYFGYYPLINNLKLPPFILMMSMIKHGIMAYPLFFDEVSTEVLCDRDMHITKYTGSVVPAFSSFGCPRKCSFCPASANMDGKVVRLNEKEFGLVLERYSDTKFDNIHMMDEDFFLSPKEAKANLAMMAKTRFNFIVLGSTATILRFVKKYGWDPLHEAKVKLLEVGLETADESMVKEMGKPGFSKAEELANTTEIDVFWLSMTFFPGETIGTLNRTGDFLGEYGESADEVYPRIVTNGTRGGLGQFFQPYIGTPDYKKRLGLGIQLTPRPIRLRPSFVPDSFLISKGQVIADDDYGEVFRFWRSIYHVEHVEGERLLWKMSDGKKVMEVLQNLSCSKEDALIYLALAAKLGILKEEV